MRIFLLWMRNGLNLSPFGEEVKKYSNKCTKTIAGMKTFKSKGGGI
jgi:hypothetical protein